MVRRGPPPRFYVRVKLQSGDSADLENSDNLDRKTVFSIFWNLSSASARPDFIQRMPIIFIFWKMNKIFCVFGMFLRVIL